MDNDRQAALRARLRDVLAATRGVIDEPIVESLDEYLTPNPCGESVPGLRIFPIVGATIRVDVLQPAAMQPGDLKKCFRGFR